MQSTNEYFAQTEQLKKALNNADMANEIGRKFGFSELDFRKKAQNKRTAEETHIILKGGTSWKEDLREVIEEGKRTATC